VDSPRTLVHAPGAWEPSPAEEGRRPRTPRVGARPKGTEQTAPKRPLLGRYHLLEMLGAVRAGADAWRTRTPTLLRRRRLPRSGRVNKGARRVHRILRSPSEGRIPA
jgi:hypothetical protein